MYLFLNRKNQNIPIYTNLKISKTIVWEASIHHSAVPIHFYLRVLHLKLREEVVMVAPIIVENLATVATVLLLTRRSLRLLNALGCTPLKMSTEKAVTEPALLYRKSIFLWTRRIHWTIIQKIFQDKCHLASRQKIEGIKS